MEGNPSKTGGLFVENCKIAKTIFFALVAAQTKIKQLPGEVQVRLATKCVPNFFTIVISAGVETFPLF